MNFSSKLVMALSLGCFSLSCSPEAMKAYRPEVFEKATIKKVVIDPRLDILFVVDNSMSMDSHQSNLATNVEKFTAEFTKSSFIDYHIGVITTDKYSGGGLLVGDPRFVNKKTPNINSVLASNLMVGTLGSGSEMVFDPVEMALSIPHLNGWNAGFYRAGATLALIFITDAEDQSIELNEVSFYKFLLGLKGGDASKVLAFGAIVPTNDPLDCDRDDGLRPRRIEGFLAALPNNTNNVVNLCDPDYGNRLANMAKSIVDEISTLRLSQVPYVPSIKITWGNIELPPDLETGWSFDPKLNTIHLGNRIDWTSQPSGTQLNITYDVAKFK
ncbi:MAG: VWA domain-containing protein [Bdellovibrionaceae bacterium]|nr:VWA domain-containing protein [Pseudobdellovibrionaceae bacterium]